MFVKFLHKSYTNSYYQQCLAVKLTFLQVLSCKCQFCQIIEELTQSFSTRFVPIPAFSFFILLFLPLSYYANILIKKETE